MCRGKDGTQARIHFCSRPCKLCSGAQRRTGGREQWTVREGDTKEEDEEEEEGQ